MTNKLRKELVKVLDDLWHDNAIVTLDQSAQAIIDHLAPTMREVVGALQDVNCNPLEYDGDLVEQALASLSEWQEKGE